MGIYDRDYYRREGTGFLAALGEQGRVTSWLIGINVVCFILQIVTRSQTTFTDPLGGRFALLDEPFTNALLLDVDRVMRGQVWRLLTYAFLHDTVSLWHILFNMLMLFWFGRQVEDTIGGREYLLFYLAAAILSGVCFTVATLLDFHAGRALGASGAVTAVLVVASIINPRQVIYLFFVLPVPIWGFVIFMVAKDAFDLLGRSSTGVATSAHLGGAAFGFAYYKLHWRLSGWWLRLTAWRQSRPRSRAPLRIYREDDETPEPQPVARATAPAAITPVAGRLIEDEQLEAQVDAILQKIPQVGMQGLTEGERQVLLRASEAIKRRRT